ncbi:MAG: DUF4407 domain-containing protein [Flavobacteriaceae bacterium]
MLQRFFWMCSGADTYILNNSSKAEQTKYAGIGATVFFTAVMATIAASYALFTVFDNAYSSIFFGLIWGLLIFNLDRFIISTIKKNDNKWKEIWQATPRIILAIIIAIVIAKPLELKIFEKEINQVLLEQKNELTLANKIQIANQYTPEINSLQNDITFLKAEISTKEQSVDSLYETYISEAEGRKGTLLLGKGPVYKEKREKHDAGLTELKGLKGLKETNKQKITNKEIQIASLNTDQKNQEATTQPIIDGFDGLMARINALNSLPWLPSFFIFLLFLAIETSPILAKLIAPKGAYDFKLQDQEDAVKTWVEQKVHQRAQVLKTDMHINEEIYSDLTEEEELYNYKRKKARELLQQQADAFHKSQQKVIG